MKLQDKVEQFLSKSDYIQIISEEDLTAMNIIFGVNHFADYMNMDNHKDLRKYFTDRKITMIIDENSEERTFSLVDKKSGDSLNIKNVKFISGYFEKFLETVPKNREIQIFLAAVRADGMKIFPLPNPDNKILKIRGYSYIQKKSS